MITLPLYTKERWLLLCQCIEQIQSMPEPITTQDFRLWFRTEDDYSFVVGRLFKLGIVAFQDLGEMTEGQKRISSEIAFERYERIEKPQGFQDEMDLLYAPVRCLAGGPIRVLKHHFADLDVNFDNLEVCTKARVNSFAQGYQGSVVFVMDGPIDPQ